MPDMDDKSTGIGQGHLQKILPSVKWAGLALRVSQLMARKPKGPPPTFRISKKFPALQMTSKNQRTTKTMKNVSISPSLPRGPRRPT